MNLDDLLKSIREENGDSKGGKVDPDKLIQRRTYKAPAKFSSQSFRAPSIKPTPSRKLGADKLAPTETIQVGKDFLDKIDELIQVIKEDNELEKDRQDALDKEKARERRQTRENRIEVGKIFSGFTKGFKRVTGQFNDIINTVIRFLAFTVLGGLVKFLFDFLRNPKNKGFLKNVQKFFTVTLPQKFKEAKQKVGEVIKFFEETVPRIQAFAENFRQLLTRFPFLGELFKTEEEKKSGLPPDEGIFTTPGKDPFFGFEFPIYRLPNFKTFSSGGLAMALAMGGGAFGTDTVPAMLTPGEFVMSRGAVSKFGVDTMMAMNKAGGGTNRPKFGIVPGYSGGGIIQDLRDEMDRRGITDAKTRAMYLAQFKEESGLKLKSEMSYRNTSADRIRAHFYNARNMSNAEIDALKKNDVAFFNHMYGDMLDNRGEGYKYRGRGYIQLTGRDNYRTIGKAIGVDLESNPDLLLDHDTALKASFEYMRSRVSQSALKRGDVKAVTLAINGGYNGLKHREQYYNEFLPLEEEYIKKKSKTKSKPVGPHFGPGFDSNDRAQSERLDLIELMQKNRAQQRADRSDINLDRLFNPIRRFFGVDTPNVPTSNSFMVLPTIDQPSDTGPTTQIATDIPEFDIVSGANMRGLYSQVLGIEDLT